MTRSMTAAADVLFVTQSAVSKSIKELERTVGFSLFARRRGGLVPSREGEALFGEVERAFLGLSRIAATAKRIRSRQHGHLRILASPALTATFLQRVIRAFGIAHPDVTVSMLTHASPEVVDLMASGQFDLGYAMTPIARTRGLRIRVRMVTCVCLLPPRHRLARQARIAVGDLAKARFVSLSEGNPTRLKIDATFKNENIDRRLTHEASWSAAIVGFVAAGAGASIVDPFSIEMAQAMGCSVHRFEPAIPFSFAEITPAAGRTNELANLFSAAFEAQLVELEATLPTARRLAPTARRHRPDRDAGMNR